MLLLLILFIIFIEIVLGVGVLDGVLLESGALLLILEIILLDVFRLIAFLGLISGQLLRNLRGKGFSDQELLLFFSFFVAKYFGGLIILFDFADHF